MTWQRSLETIPTTPFWGRGCFQQCTEDLVETGSKDGKESSWSVPFKFISIVKEKENELFVLLNPNLQ